LTLQQSFVFQTTLFLIFLPGEINDFFIKLLQLLFVPQSLFLHFFMRLVPLACKMLLLLDCAV
jgi:hypothetical protein